MPKAHKKTSGVEEEKMEEATPHGAINEYEANLHTQKLVEIIEVMTSRIEEGDAGAMKQATMDCKEAITMMMPSMEEVDPMIV